MQAIVTDIHTRTAWSVARSLARRGIDVLGVRTRASRFDRSRYYSRQVDAPALERDPTGWLNALHRIGRPGDVVMPVSIGATTAIAEHREQFANGATVPPVTAQQLDLATDKERTFALARELDIATPQTFAPTSLAEAEKALDELGLPVVIKLREEAHFAAAERFGIARDRNAFRHLFRSLAARQERPLVQAYQPGHGAAVAFLAHEGRLRAVFGHRRLREQTRDGGPSTWCEPCDDPALEATARRFAEATRWSGLAMLEFRRAPDGALTLLEVNPRFWGSMPLAIACGVDFPQLFFEFVRRGRCDGPVVRASRWRRMKFAGTDLVATCDDVAARPAAERRALAAASIREWGDPRLRLGLVDWRDPLVSVAELRDTLAGLRRLARLAV